MGRPVTDLAVLTFLSKEHLKHTFLIKNFIIVQRCGSRFDAMNRYYSTDFFPGHTPTPWPRALNLSLWRIPPVLIIFSLFFFAKEKFHCLKCYQIHLIFLENPTVDQRASHVK